jgi:hypothetical protein
VNRNQYTEGWTKDQNAHQVKTFSLTKGAQSEDLHPSRMKKDSQRPKDHAFAAKTEFQLTSSRFLFSTSTGGESDSAIQATQSTDHPDERPYCDGPFSSFRWGDGSLN